MRKETRKTIGERLRYIRKHVAAATLQEIAERTSTSPSYISRIENGQIMPSFEAVEQIADACGVRLSFIINDI